MKTHKVYKVLLKRRGKLYSAIKSIHSDTLEKGIHYKWNKWNRPAKNANPFLFVFDEKVCAKRFANRLGLKVYEARARKVSTTVFTKRDYTVFASSTEFPYGTLFCSSLKLVKRVKS